MTALAAFGDSSDLAYAINTSGQVVGIARLAGGATHAVGWQNGAAIDLGVGEARGVNSAGQVVGFCCATPGNVSSGVTWRNGDMAKLSELIDPAIGWKITSANAINDAGQILGGGIVQSRAGVFLLTPKP